MLRISREVARRFLLGRAGIWPGRRWQGLKGTETAMRAMGNLQLDPLQIAARAQDLALQSRVVDYHPDDWATLTYERRKFFEWGGWLAVRPIEELPYYRVLMRRSRGDWWADWVLAEHAPAIEEMRRILPKRREIANRDFAVGERARVDSYRGRKDSSVALHYLWRIGEAMVTRRTPTFERVYAPTKAVAPRRFLGEASDEEADDFILLKMVRSAGFSRFSLPNRSLQRDVGRGEIAAWRDRKIEDGVLIEVEIEGLKGRYVALAAETPLIETLVAGRRPRGWRPLAGTTDTEATFLSPLDPVIHDRARTLALWDFLYKWGVYDKVEKRAYGYYDLPILWGDRLVGRFDPKLDRTASTLVIKGFWLEDEGLAKDEAFAEALARGMVRFLGFLGADRVDASAVSQAGLRARLAVGRTGRRRHSC
jgi:uncharacterized protein YcaQ